MRESEFNAHAGLQAGARIKRESALSPVERPGLLASVAGFLGAIADRLAPLLALVGFMAALGLLAETVHAHHIVPLHLLWALIALACAVVAMRAFWSTHK